MATAMPPGPTTQGGAADVLGSDLPLLVCLAHLFDFADAGACDRDDWVRGCAALGIGHAQQRQAWLALHTHYGRNGRVGLSELDGMLPIDSRVVTILGMVIRSMANGLGQADAATPGAASHTAHAGGAKRRATVPAAAAQRGGRGGGMADGHADGPSVAEAYLDGLQPAAGGALGGAGASGGPQSAESEEVAALRSALSKRFSTDEIGGKSLVCGGRLRAEDETQARRRFDAVVAAQSCLLCAPVSI